MKPICHKGECKSPVSHENQNQAGQNNQDFLNQLQKTYDHALVSQDQSRVIAWNDWQPSSPVFDMQTHEILFKIEPAYISFIWHRGGIEIMASDRIVTVIYDGYTGKRLRYVEATY